MYLMPTLDNAFISASIVRAILKHGGTIEHLVPAETAQFLKDNAYVRTV
jgi:pantetheine-phosphate adenylyltransferase